MQIGNYADHSGACVENDANDLCNDANGAITM